MLAHTTLGVGPRRVLVLHDWFCDRTSWEPVRPYLDVGVFTYVFADLRGYGGSSRSPASVNWRGTRSVRWTASATAPG